MALKFYDSPFHVTHNEEVANKMAMKMDLSIMLTDLINAKNWTQTEAAENLAVTQSRISDLKNSKIEKFTIDAMLDMLDKFGFKMSWSMPTRQKAMIVIEQQKLQEKLLESLV
jgi:predicted XRE-type DNA-binding protein